MAMAQAWADHHHARDQTWKALQMEALLAAGMIGVDAQANEQGATLVAGVLTVLAALFGIGISLHHRELEIRKFRHILNCEEALGLHQPHLISGVRPPGPVRFHDVFLFWKTNTALFILRMHVTVAAFAVLYVVYRAPGSGAYALLLATATLLAAATAASVLRASRPRRTRR